MRGWARLMALPWIAALSVGVPRIEAQEVRGWVGAGVQAVTLRPVEPREGPCEPGAPCYRTLDPQVAAIATQDLSLTGWGFGVQGLSATAYLRSRFELGSAIAWPRSGDAFDALLAYAELVRGPILVRAGRQEIPSGLGFPSFDGVAVRWMGPLRAEVYGGRSLARGLREPENTAIRGIEDFVPDQGVRIVGASAEARIGWSAVTARYQREILADRSGLASERASLDLSAPVPRARLAASLDYDFAFDRVGKADLTVTAPLAGGRGVAELTARRYLPYFSLNTIWGFFEPVAYSEAVIRLGWAPAGPLAAWITAGERWYGDAATTTVLRALDRRGTRVGAGVRWSGDAGVSAEAGYHLEWGPDGYVSALDVAAGWRPFERLGVRGFVTTFQQIEQYRLGDGRALGGGGSLDASITPRIALSGGVSLLRHLGQDTAEAAAWSQTRGWSSLRIAVGEDPGPRARRSP